MSRMGSERVQHLLLWLPCPNVLVLTLPWLLSLLSFGTAIAQEELPGFSVEPESQVVKEMTAVHLRCEASTDNTAISWMYEGLPVSTDQAWGVEVRSDSSLFIRRFQKTTEGSDDRGHDGLYQCVASNSAGTVIGAAAKLEAAYLGIFYQGLEDLYIDATEGNVALIPCSPPSGRPNPETTFLLNGTNIDLNNGRYEVMQSGNLQIRDARAGDRGRYRCVRKNKVSGEVRTAPNIVHLNVVPPLTNSVPKFTWVPKDASVNRGDSITLECVVEGAPVPVVTWSKYGGKLPEGRHEEVLGNLVIHDVNKLDEGTYICGASNGIGTADVAIAQVDVLEPPELTDPLSSQTVEEGDSAVFKCIHHGQASITWYHNGEVLEDTEGLVSITGMSVKLNQVQASQSGVYQCVASSRLGETSSVAVLSVVKRGEVVSAEQPDQDWPRDGRGTAPEVEDIHPFITTLPQNTTLRTGGDALLPCILRHHRVLYGENFQWLKNSDTIDRLVVVSSDSDRTRAPRRASSSSNRGQSKLRVLPSGSLQIFNAQVEDSGEYTCVLWIDDTSDSASAYLTVEALAGTNVSQAHLLDPHPSQADGRDRDRDVFEISDEEQEEGGRNGGGRNRGNGGRRRNKDGNRGRQRASAEQPPIVEEEEETKEMVPPSRPDVSKLSDTSVMVEWVASSNLGLPINFFKVQFKEMVRDKGRRQWRTIEEDIPSHIRQFEVSGLKPGSTYKFRIVAVYSNNDNLQSPNSQKFTLETTHLPMVEPTIVKAQVLSETSIRISWQYMPEQWVPIEGFRVYFRPYSGSREDYTESVYGAHMRDMELINLQPNITYSIRMRGFSRNSESDFSNSVVAHTAFTEGKWDDIFDDAPPPPPETTPSSPVIETPSSTEESSRLLYIVLGCVLGVMVLFLLFMMAMCARKQKQRARMLAAIEGRNKFHDPARTIHAQDSLHTKQTNGHYGNGFLLNGLNGHAPAVSNGSTAGYTYPRMNVTANPMTEDGSGTLPYQHQNGHPRGNSVQELRGVNPDIPAPVPMAYMPGSSRHEINLDQSSHGGETDRESQSQYEPHMSSYSRSSHSRIAPHRHHPHPARYPTPTNRDPGLYDQPPEYSSIGSHRSPSRQSANQDQISWRSGSEVSPYRVHDPLLTDYIPRSHERLPYRRGGDPDRVSEHSQSSASQVSAQHKRRRRKATPSPECIMKDQATNTPTATLVMTTTEHPAEEEEDLDHHLAEDLDHHRAEDLDHLDHHRAEDLDHHCAEDLDHHLAEDLDHHLAEDLDHHLAEDLDHHLANIHIPAPSTQDNSFQSDDNNLNAPDYEFIDESSVPFIQKHYNNPLCHQEEESDDDEPLPEIPPSPPPLPRFPRVHDYPPSDPEEEYPENTRLDHC